MDYAASTQATRAVGKLSSLEGTTPASTRRLQRATRKVVTASRTVHTLEIAALHPMSVHMKRRESHLPKWLRTRQDFQSLCPEVSESHVDLRRWQVGFGEQIVAALRHEPTERSASEIYRLADWWRMQPAFVEMFAASRDDGSRNRVLLRDAARALAKECVLITRASGQRFEHNTTFLILTGEVVEQTRIERGMVSNVTRQKGFICGQAALASASSSAPSSSMTAASSPIRIGGATHQACTYRVKRGEHREVEAVRMCGSFPDLYMKARKITARRYVAFLHERAPCFAGWTPAQMSSQLSHYVRRISVQRGQLIFQPGQVASELCFVHSGRVAIFAEVISRHLRRWPVEKAKWEWAFEQETMFVPVAVATTGHAVGHATAALPCYLFGAVATEETELLMIRRRPINALLKAHGGGTKLYATLIRMCQKLKRKQWVTRFTSKRKGGAVSYTQTFVPSGGSSNSDGRPQTSPSRLRSTKGLAARASRPKAKPVPTFTARPVSKAKRAQMRPSTAPTAMRSTRSTTARSARRTRFDRVQPMSRVSINFDAGGVGSAVKNVDAQQLELNRSESFALRPGEFACNRVASLHTACFLRQYLLRSRTELQIAFLTYVLVHEDARYNAYLASCVSHRRKAEAGGRRNRHATASPLSTSIREALIALEAQSTLKHGERKASQAVLAGAMAQRDSFQSGKKEERRRRSTIVAKTQVSRKKIDHFRSLVSEGLFSSTDSLAGSPESDEEEQEEDAEGEGADRFGDILSPNPWVAPSTSKQRPLRPLDLQSVISSLAEAKRGGVKAKKTKSRGHQRRSSISVDHSNQGARVVESAIISQVPMSGERDQN